MHEREHYCMQGSGFHEDELRLWLAESLLALEYIHSKGVIHRDLKPSNLFLNDARDILIGDFGLATYRRGEPDEDHSFVGTAPYMSPEIVNNEEHGFETDIWCDCRLKADYVAGVRVLCQLVACGVVRPEMPGLVPACVPHLGSCTPLFTESLEYLQVAWLLHVGTVVRQASLPSL